MVAVIVAALEWFWWMIIVFAWVLFIFLTMSFARSKGRSPLLWGLLACFFPLITVIVLLLIPPSRKSY
jgi:hypothetical protein